MGTNTGGNYMFLGDDESITRPCIYYEVDVQQDFAMKKKIYENKELFHQIDEPEKTSNEIDEINEFVNKGKTILLQSINHRNKLDLYKNDVSNSINNIVSVCNDMISGLSTISKVAKHHAICDEQFDTTNKNIITNINNLKESVIQQLQEREKQSDIRIKEQETIIRQLGKTYGILKSATLNYSCPICISNSIEVFCDPCGHTFCEGCMKSNYCFLCRTKINKVKKLYISMG